MRGLVLSAVLALAACDPPGGAGAPERRMPDGDGSTGASVPVPENAIQVGDQYYMVPLAEKVGGCSAYTPFSPTRRVPQAIHYRTADGRFVMDRGQAVCD